MKKGPDAPKKKKRKGRLTFYLSFAPIDGIHNSMLHSVSAGLDVLLYIKNYFSFLGLLILSKISNPNFRGKGNCQVTSTQGLNLLNSQRDTLEIFD